MARENCTQDYLLSVAGHIHWRRARAPLLRELGDHIADQAGSYESGGLSRDEAVQKAVADMGDPAAVGEELNALHRPKNCWGILIGVVLILALGIGALALTKSGDMFSRQLLALAVGLSVMVFFWLGDYTLLIRKLGLCAGLFAALCAALIFMFRFGKAVGLSEYFTMSSNNAFSKCIYLFILIPVLYAALLCRLRGRGKGTIVALALLIFPLVFPCYLLPDLSAAIMNALSMAATLTAAVWMGWFRTKRLAGLACATVPLLSGVGWGLFQLLNMPYVWDRLSVLFHPERDPLRYGYEGMLVRSVLSRTPFFRLPTPDAALTANEVRFLRGNMPGFDLTWLSTRFGWWLLVAAGLVTVAFTLWSLYRASKLGSVSGRLMVCSCTVILAVQAAGYLMTNLGLRLLNVTALPFFTYGPGYLLADLFLLGVILSVFRMDALVRDMSGIRFTPAALPDSLDIPLPFGRGSIHIERRKA